MEERPLRIDRPGNLRRLASGPPADPDRREAGGPELTSADLKPPSVSVVVTSYDYGRYLGACLESIASQTFAAFDCVVVDDVSSDDSVAVAKRFLASDAAAGRFRLVRHVENRGQMAAMRTGLEHTEGTFVVFVDADDVLLPDFIETHVGAHLNRSHAVAFTCSDQLQIDAAGEVIGGTYPTLLREREEVGPGGRAGLPSGARWSLGVDEPPRLSQTDGTPVYLPALAGSLGGWFWSTTSAMMYRRAALDLVLSRDCHQFRICADFYLVTFCQAVGGSVLIPTVHGCYRRHGRNGFGRNPMVGGEQSPGDMLRHPDRERYRRSFAEHVAAEHERFVSILGPDRASRLFVRFAPRDVYLRLLREGSALGRLPLLRDRIAWKVLRRYYRVRALAAAVRRLVAAGP